MKIIVDRNGKVHRQQPDDPTKGASLQAQIGVTYDRLLEVFGEPTAVCQGTEAVAWDIYTPAGVATIYNWRGCLRPCVEHTTIWEVAAHSREPVKWIKEALGFI